MPWAEILKVIDLRPRYLFAIWFSGALILLFPAAWGPPGLAALRAQWGAVVWVISVVISVVTFVFWAVKIVSFWGERLAAASREQEERERVLANLGRLTRAERTVLTYCLVTGRRRVFLKPGTAAADGLERKGLLVAGWGIGPRFPYGIPEFVWERLTEQEAWREEFQRDRTLQHEVMELASWDPDAFD